MIRKTAVSALLFSAFLTTPALGEEPQGDPAAWPRAVTVSATVDYGGLDLATPAGQAEARRRTADAVAELCRPETAPAGPRPSRIDGHCYRQAMASARVQLDRTIAARSGQVRTAQAGPAVGTVRD